jgi:hypothetical protein
LAASAIVSVMLAVVLGLTTRIRVMLLIRAPAPG